ncbi:hypothetical protein NHH03_01170 [Stieleria sp. TO1_6]|uniref:hypothetical protein n=1 Tax=Stieleria tagensis TaxID=2956795 RepID=UPI00209A8761|nr:hypothetical protein [Stieleria tagensis]MCO8120328.1 hypothetical protein [Stieleria tagensis]
MSELQRLSLEKIRHLVAETEGTLGELKSELGRREAAAQDAELDHLEEHFKNAELSLGSIRDFISYLVEQYRSKH